MTRLIRVFTDRAPVPMAQVACPACGHTLDTICRGYQRIPYHHRHDTGNATSNHLAGGLVCRATSDDLAVEVARAQLTAHPTLEAAP